MSNEIDKDSIAIILGSSRKKGNTARLVETVCKNIDHHLYDLLDYNIGYYDYNNKNQNDDFLKLMDEISLKHNHLVFATPVYWYSMSAIMKCFLDRFTDLISIQKDIGRRLRQKKLSLISCSNQDDLNPGFSEPFILSADYLGMEFIAHLHAWLAEEKIPSELNDRVQSFQQSFLS